MTEPGKTPSPIPPAGEAAPPAPRPPVPGEADIMSVLMAVEDPELRINIVDLGLIYRIDRDPEHGRVTVDMTLTSPACPYGPQLLGQTHAVLSRLPGVLEVQVNPVFSPPWDPRVHASESGQVMLGVI